MSQLLTPKELAQRWQVANNTLRKQRVAGKGPKYIKLGESRNSEVRYRLEDVEAFERDNTYTPIK